MPKRKGRVVGVISLYMDMLEKWFRRLECEQRESIIPYARIHNPNVYQCMRRKKLSTRENWCTLGLRTPLTSLISCRGTTWRSWLLTSSESCKEQTRGWMNEWMNERMKSSSWILREPTRNTRQSYSSANDTKRIPDLGFVVAVPAIEYLAAARRPDLAFPPVVHAPGLAGVRFRPGGTTNKQGRKWWWATS